MKLCKNSLLFLLAPIFAALGFFIEPLLLDNKPVNRQATNTQKDAPKKDASPTEMTAASEPELGKKEKIDLGGLLAGESAIEEEKEEKQAPIVYDDADIDAEAVTFVDAKEEDSSVEDTQKRLNRYKNSLKSSTKDFTEQDFTGSLSSVSWRNPAMLKKQLAGRIRTRLKDLEPETVEAFLAHPENRLMLTQWELLNRANMKDLAEVMKDPDFGQTMEPMLNNLPWLSGFIYDGEVKKMDVALAMVHHFRKSDPNMDIVDLNEEKGEILRDQFIKRRIAGAVAAEFSNNGWYGGESKDMTSKEINDLRLLGIPVPKKAKGASARTDLYKLARERYFFFAEGVDQRLLNSMFYTMPNWLMRFPCGWKTGDFGSLNTMRWQRANNSAPIQSYCHLLDHVPYMIVNIFGDPIAGPHYYQPTESLYPDNHNKHVRDIGAVCGGQGCYSASGAASNGVPSMIMFEPGHCSFTIYDGKKWIPCNSGSPIRFPSWSFWGDSAWSTLLLYTEMYQNGQRTRDAQLITTLADLLASNKSPINALSMYELSISMQPLNRPAWDSYIDTATKNLTTNPKRWLAVNEFLCKAMAPTNPSACAVFLRDRIYPTMLKALKSPTQKLEAYAQYFESLATQEETPWDMDGLLNLQHAPLNKAQTSQLHHYTQIAKSVCEKPQFGQALTWAITHAYKQNRPLGDRLMADVVKFRETSPDKELVDAAIIRSAEDIDDIVLFNKYSKPYMEGLGGMPEFEKPKGNLVSAGSIVHLETYADDPRLNIHHAAALTENGGALKTRGGAKEKLTIKLPKLSRIGTIIVVPTCGNCVPYFLWTVFISKDGKKWEQLAALPDKSEKPFIRLQINKQHPSARYIRIDSGEAMTYGIQFKAFLVYDNKNQ